MRFRLFVFVLMVVLAALSASLYAQNAPQPDAMLDAHVAEAFVEASAAAKSSNHDQAAQIYWSIAERFPDHADAPRAAKQAAYTIDRLGDRDRSIAAFKRALDMYPDSGYTPALKRCLALSYQAKGDKETAIRELDDLVSRYPKSDAAGLGLINLGLLHIAQVCKQNTDEQNWQRKEEADAAFSRVTETFPDKRDLCAKAEMYRAGIAFERALAKRMSWDDAIKQVQAVKEAFPDADKAILARLELMQAEKLLFGKRYSDVVARSESLIESYPNCKLEVGWAHLLAGEADLELGESAKALAHCQIVANGNYTESDNFKDRDVTRSALVSIGDCYQKMGQLDKARDAWQNVITTYPGAWEAEVAQARLDRTKEGATSGK